MLLHPTKKTRKQQTASHPAYQNRVSFYKIPPTEDVTMEQLELWAIDRLKVLREIDAAKTRGMKTEDMNNRLNQVLAKYLPLRANNESDVQKDVVSHFVLRLAYCNPTEAKWFVSQEKALLKHRLEGENLSAFLVENDLHYPSLTEGEFKSIEPELRAVAETARAFDRGSETLRTGAILSSLNAHSFFVIPFEEAAELISQRRVYLRGGNAYVYRDQMVSIVLGRYRTHLMQALNTAYKAHPQTRQKFQRITPFLENLSKQYLGSDYSQTNRNVGDLTGPISPEQIDALAKRSFPMCMKNMHRKIKESHHLKHQGRMQFGLFLKGIGVTLEDALAFWRAEFSKLIGVDKFEKEYAYNIRHNYGKEGKRTSYTPYSCLKIILGPPPSSGETHGCPFRQDLKALETDLLNQGLSSSGVKHVVELARENHYQIACSKHFELTHGGSPGVSEQNIVINHPNGYFEESVKYYALKSGGSSSSSSGKPVSNINNTLMNKNESTKSNTNSDTHNSDHHNSDTANVSSNDTTTTQSVPDQIDSVMTAPPISSSDLTPSI